MNGFDRLVRALFVLAGIAGALALDGALGGAAGAGRLFDPFLVVVVAAALRLRPHAALVAAAATGLAQDALGAVVLGISLIANVVAAWIVILIARAVSPGLAAPAPAARAGRPESPAVPVSPLRIATSLAAAFGAAAATRFAAGFVLGQELALPGPLALLGGLLGTVVVGTLGLSLLFARRRRRWPAGGRTGGHAFGRA